MVSKVESVFLDAGLTAAQAAITSILICSSEPTTYASATTTALLGTKSFGAGSAFSGPSAGTSPTGRKLVSAAVTDGTVTTTGTASWWAAVSGSSLYAHGLLSSAQAVTSGNSWTLAAFDIRIADE